MNALQDLLASPGLFLAACLFILMGILGIVTMLLSRSSLDCDCPRYLLRRQSGDGLVWKTHHRVDCGHFGT